MNASLSQQNSTNVRILPRPTRTGGGAPLATRLRFGAVAAGLKLLGAIAPELAARAAIQLFSTPLLRPARKSPEAPGLAAHRFWIDTPTARVAAWDWGRGPTVLLVHGWEGQAADLSPLVAPLVARGFHVVAFDLPAHGQSEGTTTNLIEVRDAIRAVASRMGGVHAIAAHSFGGAASVLAAAHGLATGPLALFAPPGSMRPFFDRFGSTLLLSQTQRARMLAGIERRVGVRISDLELPHQASRLSGPMLLVHDRADREVSFEWAPKLHLAWRGSELLATSGLGHRRILRDPAVVARAVEFLVGERLPRAIPAA